MPSDDLAWDYSQRMETPGDTSKVGKMAAGTQS